MDQEFADESFVEMNPCTFEETMPMHRRSKSPSNYQQTLKENLKRKVSSKNRYETNMRSPKERRQIKQTGAYDAA